MKSFLGMVWFPSDCGQSGHVTVWINADGTETISYNLMDSQGDKDMPKRKTKKLAPIWDIIVDCIDKARAEAIYHRDYSAARRKETTIAKLRFAFCCTVGRGGTTVYQDEQPNSSATLSGYGSFSPDELAEIDRLGIPYIDSTTIPCSDIGKVIAYPMIPRKPDQVDAAPWSSLSFAPIAVIAALYQQLGAIVKNIEPDYSQLEQVKGWTSRGKAAYIGYTSGNSELLAKAMLDDGPI